MLLLLLVIALVVRPVTSKNGHAPWGIPVYTKVDTTNVRAVSAQQSSFVWEGVISYAFADDSFLSYQDRCSDPLPPNTCAPFVGMYYTGVNASTRVSGPAGTDCMQYNGGQGKGYACGKWYSMPPDENGNTQLPDNGNYYEGYNPVIQVKKAGKLTISSTGVVTIKLASKAVAGQLIGGGWTVQTVDKCAGTPTAATCIDDSGGVPTMTIKGTTMTLALNGAKVACKGKKAGQAASCDDVNLVLTSPYYNYFWSRAYDGTSGQFFYVGYTMNPYITNNAGQPSCGAKCPGPNPIMDTAIAWPYATAANCPQYGAAAADLDLTKPADLKTYNALQGQCGAAANKYLTNFLDGSPYTEKLWQLSTYYAATPGAVDYEVGSSTPYPIVAMQPIGLLATAQNAISWTVTGANAFDIPDVVGENCPNYGDGSSDPGTWGCPASLVYVNGDAVNKLPRVWIQGTQKVSMTVQAPQDLREFPLDTQTISFNFINAAVPASDMYFVMTAMNAQSAPPTNAVDGYTVVSTKISVTQSDKPNQNSQVNVQFVLKRIPDVYFNRFILPLTLVSTLILTLQFANTAARTMAGFTIIGTTTSFVFISSNSVPLLPYRTRLDNYFVFQFVLAFSIGLWNIYSTHNNDRFKDKYLKYFKENGFVSPKGWSGWLAAVLGLPSRYRNPEAWKAMSAKVVADIESGGKGEGDKVKPAKDDKAPAGDSVPPSDDKKADDKAWAVGDSKKDDKKDDKKEEEKEKKIKTTEQLLTELVDFHVKGKEKTTADTKQKTEYEKIMAEHQLAFDIRLACVLVVAYCVCVSSIFLLPMIQAPVPGSPAGGGPAPASVLSATQVAAFAPSYAPFTVPTQAPTLPVPTYRPSSAMPSTAEPTVSPTFEPTVEPTVSPTFEPTFAPTESPT